MPVKLTTLANERSTYGIEVTFLDEDGDLVTPVASSVTWTLTDGLGTVVNSRENVAITSASTITIVLSGADLAVDSSLYQGRDRKLIIKASYNSDLGSGLPLRDEVSFRIQDFPGLTS